MPDYGITVTWPPAPEAQGMPSGGGLALPRAQTGPAPGASATAAAPEHCTGRRTWTFPGRPDQIRHARHALAAPISTGSPASSATAAPRSLRSR
jgi:hypothetical protein